MKKLVCILALLILTVSLFADDFEIKGKKLIKYTGNAETVQIPDGIKEIGEKAFEKQDKVISVSGKDVTEIDIYGFRGCKSLKNVDFPMLKTIGEEAFRDTGLEEIEFNKELKKINDFAFAECPLLKKINIESVTKLGKGVFFSCVELEEIVLPKYIDRFESKLFFNCKKLVNFNFPVKLKYIENQVFFNCKSIENIDIPRSVEIIKSEAFAYSGVKVARIDNLTRDIAGNIFFGCTKKLIIKCKNGSEAKDMALRNGYEIKDF